MFTVKYRYWMAAPDNQSNVAGAVIPGSWVSHEQIWGPYEFVTRETDSSGYPLVYCHHHRAIDAEHGSLPMTFGPIEPTTISQGPPRPTLWVMNEAGSTVAKYDL